MSDMFKEFVAKELTRQREELGYTIEHDQEQGRDHLISEMIERLHTIYHDGSAEDFIGTNKAVEVAAMLYALTEVLDYPPAPKATYDLPIPLVAPFGWPVNSKKFVQDVWDAFVKPSQDAGEPQSGEMRVLMAILRAVNEAMPFEETTKGNVGQITPGDKEVPKGTLVFDGAICPECKAGKHQNCDGVAYVDDEDNAFVCACEDDSHGRG